MIGADDGGGIWEMIAPERFVATGLRVRQGEALDTGSRTWTLRTLDGEVEAATALSCSVEAGERACESNARVSIPAGAEICWRIVSEGTSAPDYALVSWRAVLP